jgi:hypothetical protein
VAKFEVLMHSLNTGVVDRNKLHRIDLTAMRLAAEDQTNIIPTVVGPGIFRQGFGFRQATKSNAECYQLPFVAGDDESYLLELTNTVLRVWDPATDLPIVRPQATSTVSDSGFDGVGWTLSADAGQSSTIVGSALLLFAIAKGATAYGKQQVTTSSPGVLHALRITVPSGPVTLRVGSTDGADDYVEETQLRTGIHSIAFVPAGSYWIKFSNSEPYYRSVSDCAIEAAGTMELTTPWTLAQLPLVRFTQSVDVMYLACEGVRRMRIERRGDGAAAGYSWSIVNYDSDDGPFMANASADITLAPASTYGETTLTASAPFFRTTHVGALFRIYHDGQAIDEYLAAAKEHTSTFVVTGVNEADYNERSWTMTISGTWVGTLVVERSFDGEDFGFHEFRRETASSTIDITANATFNNEDAEDNAIVWYRVTFKAYTSGSARIVISYAGGGGQGIARVTQWNSSTNVNVQALTPFKGVYATKDWQEGEWSTYRGQPAGVEFHEGRLIWVAPDRIAGSVSDAFDSFDDTFTGDAGPIIRSIALGARNEARWALSMSALIVGCDGRLAEARASVLGDIITPESFGVHNLPSRGGVAKIAPVAIDGNRALYVHQSRKKIFELSYDSGSGRYLATEFSKLTTDLFSSGIRSMALQTLPDQRIWVTTNDGNAVLIVFEPEHKVAAFIPIAMATGDVLESVCVLPNGDEDDRLYGSIKRTVGGVAVRYIEKLALDSEALPATITKCVDSFVTFGAVDRVDDLDHLEGRTVVGWMDGSQILNEDGTAWSAVVNDLGQVFLPRLATTGGVVGLPYRGRYKSARLEYGVEGSTTIKRKKQIAEVGLLLSDYVRSGVKFGNDFTPGASGGTLQSLPLLNSTTSALATEVVEGLDEDEDFVPLPGQWKLDARLCIELNSPNPATIRAFALGIVTQP